MLKMKLIRLGDAQGGLLALCLPERLVRRYALAEGTVSVSLETAPDGLLLRPARAGKLSWKATAAATAKRKETWAAWDEALADGLETL